VIKDWLRKFPSYFQPFDWHHAAVSAPGMAACLIYGLISHDTLTAAIAGGSAFSVGFGLRRNRETLSMLGAAVVMTVATVVGSLIGGNLLLFTIVLAAASAGCAMLALVDDDSWWVALQATIALLLASHYGADVHGASQRGGIVLVTGIAQTGLVLLLNRLIPRGNPKAPPNVPIPATKRALMLYGLVAGLSVGGALLLAHAVRLDKAYWAPMTALIVLKPKYHLTRQRGFERLGGNVAGCALATLIAVCLPPLAWFDTVLCILGSAAAYGLLKARYAAFSFAVSFTAVMLLFTAHQSAVIGAEQRLYATVLGGATSIVVMWLISKTVARDYLL
jgi:uncharacterized membrane protein YgaE (UPF0421/DUF939 family)